MQALLRRWNRVGNYSFTLIVFLFFLLFSPPLIPGLNTGMLASIWAAVMLMVRYRSRLIDVLKKSGILQTLFFFLLFLIYLAAITAVNTLILGERVQPLHYLTLWYRMFLICPLLFAASAYLCLRFRELGCSFRQICGHWIGAVLAQFLLVLLCLLVPQIKTAFTALIYQNTGDAYLNIPWVMARRGFGFANSFVDSFGWGMGLLAVLPLFLVHKKNPWPILLSPVLLFVSLVNARTGLVMLLIGLPFFAGHLIKAYRHSTGREKLQLVAALMAAFGIFLLLCLVIYVANPVTLQWIVGDLISFVPQDSAPPALQEVLEQWGDDAQTTTAEVLFSAGFWNLPSGFPLLFGTGHTLYAAAGYPHSDVGYVNDLWMGGLVGCLLLYGGFFLLFRRAWRSAGSCGQKMLVLFLGVGMAVFQIKANAIAFCAGLNVTLPLMFQLCDRGKRPTPAPALPAGCTDPVSVIVPVYRVEAELEECVCSIRNQSYPHLEILLVDDGSPDRCPAICDALAEQDTRIRVIHKQNGGLSDARNAGINAATGRYLAFVDGDDFLHRDFILTLLAAAKASGAAVAATGHVLYHSRYRQKPIRAGGDRLFSKKEAIIGIFTGQRGVDVMAWNKLYSADLFADGIRYPKGRIHEDVATTYRLVDAANAIVYVDRPLYYYRQRGGSIVHQPFSARRMDLLEMVAGIEPFVSAHPEYRDAYQFYVFYNHLTLLIAMLMSRQKSRIPARALRDATLQLYATLRRAGNPYLTRGQMLSCALMKRSLRLFAAARRFYRRISSLWGWLT